MGWLFLAPCWLLFSWSLSGPSACGKSRASASIATIIRIGQPRRPPPKGQMAKLKRAKNCVAWESHADSSTRPWPRSAVCHRFGTGIHRRKDSDFDARKQDDYPEKRVEPGSGFRAVAQSQAGWHVRALRFLPRGGRRGG